MPLDLHPLLIWLTAYLAAGAFFVLRGLGEAWVSIAKGELSGFGLVALCWLPITLGNLASLHRTGTLPAVLAQFRAETSPPLALLLAIVVTTTSLPAA